MPHFAGFGKTKLTVCAHTVVFSGSIIEFLNLDQLSQKSILGEWDSHVHVHFNVKAAVASQTPLLASKLGAPQVLDVTTNNDRVARRARLRRPPIDIRIPRTVHVRHPAGRVAAAVSAHLSGGPKFPILPLTGEISHCCLKECQEYL